MICREYCKIKAAELQKSATSAVANFLGLKASRLRAFKTSKPFKYNKCLIRQRICEDTPKTITQKHLMSPEMTYPPPT